MSTTALTPADWISRDDMATLIRKSTDTVTRDCAKHELPTQTDADNRVLVNVGDFLQINRLRPEDLTLDATPAESAEVLRARDTITTLKTQVAELRGRLGQADTLVDTAPRAADQQGPAAVQAGRPGHPAHRPSRPPRRCGMSSTRNLPSSTRFSLVTTPLDARAVSLMTEVEAGWAKPAAARSLRASSCRRATRRSRRRCSCLGSSRQPQTASSDYPVTLSRYGRSATSVVDLLARGAAPVRSEPSGTVRSRRADAPSAEPT